jgi:CO dehydrogenase maturation factor
MMKIAISGKGGVGKTTLAAALSLLMVQRGRKVLAVDADPDANLAVALGISEAKQRTIIPISQQVALIEERTGAKVKQYGQVFKLNPEVSDITDKFAMHHNGVALLVLGAIEGGGTGCACPESTLIRALVTDLVLYKDDALVMDMEAGIEHLGRGTARGVDTMIIVLEPGQRSTDSAHRVIRMAGEIGLKNIQLVANKIYGQEDEKFIRDAFPKFDLLGIIPFSEQFRQSDRNGQSVLDNLNFDLLKNFENILNKLETGRRSEN